MKRNSTKRTWYVMVILTALVTFLPNVYSSGSENCYQSDWSAEKAASTMCQSFCQDHQGCALKEAIVNFERGLCMSGSCYQYFNCPCVDGTNKTYDEDVGVMDCQDNGGNHPGDGDGGGGGSGCTFGPMGCDIKCFECHLAQ